MTGADGTSGAFLGDGLLPLPQVFKVILLVENRTICFQGYWSWIWVFLDVTRPRRTSKVEVLKCRLIWAVCVCVCALKTVFIYF